MTFVIGSYTALKPYAQERYFENHKLMSAVDKLHKLYSSTLEPIVWARSVGLEVLNEFDTVKAAIMMDAGASTRRDKGSVSPGWNLAAKGVESLAVGAHTVRVVGEGLRHLIDIGLQNLAKASKEMNRDRK